MFKEEIRILDFDGLICDSTTECILVSWNANYRKGLEHFSDWGLTQIPSSFVERFLHVRNFSQHLGHFLVSFSEADELPKTQREFNAYYAALDSHSVEAFVSKALAYRKQAREQRRTVWLQYHKLYPGIARLLHDYPLPMYIVTAKDQNSVQEILQGQQISFPPERIFGEQISKVSALHEIEQREQKKREQICFYDDNIYHLVTAKQQGYLVGWATWGYHASEHAQLANEQSIPSLSLQDLLQASK